MADSARATSGARTLTIVIPALDEEAAIGGTVARCLEAVPRLRVRAGLEAVEIIVVSDGSTDRTAEIARSHRGVRVIEFEQNRGYGAAIKEGFRQGSGAILGFLDADGTCDPETFGPMCERLLRDGADIVLGSRLGPSSKMPRLRRLGNRTFALLLGLLCGRWVTDTASGMRVMRRSALDRLQPLPDGLHFTPSMSARALLDDLRVVEIPMSYEERIGASKLHVIQDGLRFLRTIIESVLCYRPERPFMIGFGLCLALGLCIAAYPVEFYLRNGHVLEWMIYRFLACFLLGSVGWQLLGGAAIARRMSAFGPRRETHGSFWSALAARCFEGRLLLLSTGVVVALSLALLWPGIVQYVGTGSVHLHWSRVVTGVFGLVLAGQSIITGVLLRVLGIWARQPMRMVPAAEAGSRRASPRLVEPVGGGLAGPPPAASAEAARSVAGVAPVS